MPTSVRPVMPWVLAALLFVAADLVAADPASRPDPPATQPSAGPRSPSLRHVRWQTLPDDVAEVAAGPDGRVWCIVRSDAWPPLRVHPTTGPAIERRPPTDLPGWREAIGREFRRPMPRLPAGVQVALFEPPPSKRVWFVVLGGKYVLGFDGENWQQRQAVAPGGFAETYGEPVLGRNRFADGVAFFPDNAGGVHNFDRKGWVWQRTTDAPVVDRDLGITTGAPWLTVERDGKGAIAVQHAKVFRLWRYHHDAWMEIALPPELTSAQWFGLRGAYGHEPPCPVSMVVPWSADGVLMQAMGCLQFHPYSYKPGASVQTLANQLVEGDQQQRDAALAELIKLGGWTRDLVRRHIDNYAGQSKLTDYQRGQYAIAVWKRLDAVSQQQTFGPFSLRPPPGSQLVASSYTYGIAPDGRFLMFVSAISRDGKAVPHGVIIVDRQNKDYRLVPLDTWMMWPVRDLLFIDNHRVWVPQRDRPVLVDLDTGKVLAEFPVAELYMRRMAVLPDGTLVSPVNSYRSTAFNPAAPEDRLPLPGVRVPLSQPDYCIATDGAIWANLADRGPARFDGKAWEAIAPNGKRIVPPVSVRFRPGAGGAMVFSVQPAAGTREHWVFFKPGQPGKPGRAEAFSNLIELVSKRKADVVAAYPADPAVRCDRVVAADADGNVWLRDPNDYNVIRVLAGNTWLQAQTDGWMIGATAGGWGVMLSASRAKYMEYYTATVRDGKAVVQRAAVGDDIAGYWADFADADGGRWHVPIIFGTRPEPEHQEVYRTKDGKTTTYQDIGQPRLLDRSGVVWLGGIWGAPPGRFNLWRNGGVIGTMDVPGADGQTPMFSDRPGSVLLWTALGIEHYLADAKRDPGNYVQAAVYEPLGLPGAAGGQYSPLGFLVGWTRPEQPKPDCALHLFGWPAKN